MPVTSANARDYRRTATGAGVLRAVWRADGRRRLAGWMVVTLVVAIGVGVGTAAAAAARRTASAYPRLLTASAAADVVVDIGGPPPYPVLDELDSLPEVEDRADAAALAITRFQDDVPVLGTPDNVYASVDGRRYYDVDAIIVLEGRLPDGGSVDEVLANDRFVAETGIAVGDVLDLGVVTAADAAQYEPGSGPLAHEPITVEVVGVGVLPEQVVEDDVAGQRLLVGGPAFFERYADSEIFRRSAVRLIAGSDLDAFKRAVQARMGSFAEGALFEDRAAIVDRTQRAVRPHALALGVVGAFALLATAVIAGQLLARLVGEAEPTVATLRALGASPRSIAGGLLAPVVAVVVVGVAAGIVLAVVLSPLGPVGPVRPVEPARGVDVDVTAVLVAGSVVGLALLARGGLGALGTIRRARGYGRTTPGPTRVVGALTRSGAPASVTVGARRVVSPGSAAATARLILVTTVTAVGVVFAVVAFSAGLDQLLRTPRLYGNDWDATVVAESGYGALDLDEIVDDPAVTEVSAAVFGSLVVDDLEVPAMGVVPIEGSVLPPIVEGRAPASDREIVVGRDTLADLGKDVGDTVDVVLPGENEAPRMTIVGVPVLPAVGLGDAGRPGLGRGAMLELPADTLESEFRPSSAFVRLHGGRADLAAFTERHRDAVNDVRVYPDPRPADIAGFDRLGPLPALLAGTFAIVALAAITHGVVSGARRHRRDDAVLRALGAGPGQRRAVVRVQALVTIAVASAVGVPVGLALGRLSWRAFAAESGVVVTGPVPVVRSVVALAAIVLAVVVVGDVAARILVRDRPGAVLRAE